MTTKAIWLTDIHLNFLSEEARVAFYQKIATHSFDCVFLSGDIGEAHSFGGYLVDLQSIIQKPIYFVLGNHDFYHGSLRSSQGMAEAVGRDIPSLVYLSTAEIQYPSSQCALLGHDGWADARAGNYDSSSLEMNDFHFIHELSNLSLLARREKMEELAERCLLHIQRLLPQALEERERVFLITHVPPFPESCFYRGKLADEENLPFYCNSILGEYLRDTMTKYPSRELIVLCGHTHGKKEYKALDNLRCYTGKAEYEKPRAQGILPL